ncbi:ERAD-associated E3 ubiquitin-protein ligase doa10 [Diplonema papillatum]|nr:ERAD-associated E3 ubiquitin-protein ligase doa10 [Diplonema papillatum]
MIDVVFNGRLYRFASDETTSVAVATALGIEAEELNEWVLRDLVGGGATVVGDGSAVAPEAAYSLETRGSSGDDDSGSEEDADVCWICRGSAGGEELIAPCKCSGSVKSVHRKCIMAWVFRQKVVECALCRHEFKITKLYSSAALDASAPLTFESICFLASRLTAPLFSLSLLFVKWVVVLPFIFHVAWCLCVDTPYLAHPPLPISHLFDPSPDPTPDPFPDVLEKTRSRLLDLRRSFAGVVGSPWGEAWERAGEWPREAAEWAEGLRDGEVDNAVDTAVVAGCAAAAGLALVLLWSLAVWRAVELDKWREAESDRCAGAAENAHVRLKKQAADARASLATTPTDPPYPPHITRPPTQWVIRYDPVVTPALLSPPAAPIPVGSEDPETAAFSPLHDADNGPRPARVHPLPAGSPGEAPSALVERVKALSGCRVQRVGERRWRVESGEIGTVIELPLGVVVWEKPGEPGRFEKQGEPRGHDALERAGVVDTGEAVTGAELKQVAQILKQKYERGCAVVGNTGELVAKAGVPRGTPADDFQQLLPFPAPQAGLILARILARSYADHLATLCLLPLTATAPLLLGRFVLHSVGALAHLAHIPHILAPPVHTSIAAAASLFVAQHFLGALVLCNVVLPAASRVAQWAADALGSAGELPPEKRWGEKVDNRPSTGPGRGRRAALRARLFLLDASIAAHRVQRTGNLLLFSLVDTVLSSYAIAYCVIALCDGLVEPMRNMADMLARVSFADDAATDGTCSSPSPHLFFHPVCFTPTDSLLAESPGSGEARLFTGGLCEVTALVLLGYEFQSMAAASVGAVALQLRPAVFDRIQSVYPPVDLIRKSGEGMDRWTLKLSTPWWMHICDAVLLWAVSCAVAAAVIRVPLRFVACAFPFMYPLPFAHLNSVIGVYELWLVIMGYKQRESEFGVLKRIIPSGASALAGQLQLSRYLFGDGGGRGYGSDDALVETAPSDLPLRLFCLAVGSWLLLSAAGVVVVAVPFMLGWALLALLPAEISAAYPSPLRFQAVMMYPSPLRFQAIISSGMSISTCIFTGIVVLTLALTLAAAVEAITSHVQPSRFFTARPTPLEENAPPPQTPPAEDPPAPEPRETDSEPEAVVGADEPGGTPPGRFLSDPATSPLKTLAHRSPYTERDAVSPGERAGPGSLLTVACDAAAWTTSVGVAAVPQTPPLRPRRGLVTVMGSSSPTPSDGEKPGHPPPSSSRDGDELLAKGSPGLHHPNPTDAMSSVSSLGEKPTGAADLVHPPPSSSRDGDDLPVNGSPGLHHPNPTDAMSSVSSLEIGAPTPSGARGLTESARTQTGFDLQDASSPHLGSSAPAPAAKAPEEAEVPEAAPCKPPAPARLESPSSLFQHDPRAEPLASPAPSAQHTPPAPAPPAPARADSQPDTVEANPGVLCCRAGARQEFHAESLVGHEPLVQETPATGSPVSASAALAANHVNEAPVENTPAHQLPISQTGGRSLLCNARRELLPDGPPQVEPCAPDAIQAGDLPSHVSTSTLASPAECEVAAGPSESQKGGDSTTPLFPPAFSSELGGDGSSATPPLPAGPAIYSSSSPCGPTKTESPAAFSSEQGAASLRAGPADPTAPGAPAASLPRTTSAGAVGTTVAPPCETGAAPAPDRQWMSSPNANVHRPGLGLGPPGSMLGVRGGIMGASVGAFGGGISLSGRQVRVSDMDLRQGDSVRAVRRIEFKSGSVVECGTEGVVRKVPGNGRSSIALVNLGGVVFSADVGDIELVARSDPRSQAEEDLRNKLAKVFDEVSSLAQRTAHAGGESGAALLAQGLVGSNLSKSPASALDTTVAVAAHVLLQANVLHIERDPAGTVTRSWVKPTITSAAPGAVPDKGKPLDTFEKSLLNLLKVILGDIGSKPGDTKREVLGAYCFAWAQVQDGVKRKTAPKFMSLPAVPPWAAKGFSFAATFLHNVALCAVFSCVLPLMTGALVDAMFSTIPADQCPDMHVHVCHAYGWLCFKLSVLLTLSQPDLFEYPWRAHWLKIGDDGYARADAVAAVKNLALPLADILLQLLCIPYVIHNVVLPVLAETTVWAHELHHRRYSHVIFFVGFTLIHMYSRTVAKCESVLKAQMKAERYLIGLWLHEYTAPQEAADDPGSA